MSKDEPKVDPICVLQGQIDTLHADLFRQVRNQREKLNFAEDWHDDHEKRIANMEREVADNRQQCDHRFNGLLEHVAAPTKRTIEASVTVDMRVTIPMPSESFFKALDATGAKTEEIAEPGQLRPPAPPKRTIKGGWVNVYRYGSVRSIHISPVIFRTREDCDAEGINNRIACIQIPDIQEGEGL